MRRRERWDIGREVMGEGGGDGGGRMGGEENVE